MKKKVRATARGTIASVLGAVLVTGMLAKNNSNSQNLEQTASQPTSQPASQPTTQSSQPSYPVYHEMIDLDNDGKPDYALLKTEKGEVFGYAKNLGKEWEYIIPRPDEIYSDFFNTNGADITFQAQDPRTLGLTPDAVYDNINAQAQNAISKGGLPPISLEKKVGEEIWIYKPSEGKASSIILSENHEVKPYTQDKNLEKIIKENPTTLRGYSHWIPN